MRVAIIGSRSLAGVPLPLSAVVPSSVSLVVSGGARGVDSAAADWADTHGIPVREYLPDYATFGRRAPLIRNRDIIANADMVIAFWDGHSRGTVHALKIAQKMGKIIKLYRKKEEV